MTATAFAAVAVTFYAAHQLADHVLGQTDAQAATKMLPSWRGWAANLRHVAAYHAVMAGMLAAVVAVLDLPVTWTGALAGLACSAVTHAVLDRRWPVRWLLQHTGGKAFAQLAHGGLNGMYLSDQALHYTALWASALLVVVTS